MSKWLKFTNHTHIIIKLEKNEVMILISCLRVEGIKRTSFFTHFLWPHNDRLTFFTPNFPWKIKWKTFLRAIRVYGIIAGLIKSHKLIFENPEILFTFPSEEIHSCENHVRIGCRISNRKGRTWKEKKKLKLVQIRTNDRTLFRFLFAQLPK